MAGEQRRPAPALASVFPYLEKTGVRNWGPYWGGVSIKVDLEVQSLVSGSSIFVFVGKERESGQIFIINVEELPGVVLAVPLSNYSRRHFPLVKKV